MANCTLTELMACLSVSWDFMTDSWTFVSVLPVYLVFFSFSNFHKNTLTTEKQKGVAGGYMYNNTL